jgi:steroid delta-isomerase-like uncharacterized protein
MMSGENDALIRRWFDEVWNQGRAEAIDELLTEDAIVHGLSDDSEKPLRGPAAFREFHTKFLAAFPDIVVTVEDTIEDGDKVAARCLVRGKHTGDTLGFAGTQAPVAITGISITRIKDGKIVEAWNNFDFMTMYQQLGVIQL